MPIILDRLGGVLHPLTASKDCNGHRDAEESLRHSSVCRGNHGRKKVQHRHPAKNPLRDDRSQGTKPQRLHPAASVGEQRPKSDHSGAHAGKERDHAMAVFKNNAANPRWQTEEMPVRCGPVRHRQTRILACHERARDDNHQCGASDEYRDSMMPAVERCGLRPQAASSERVILSAN